MKLILSAEVGPEALYPAVALAGEAERTASGLVAMQARAYLDKVCLRGILPFLANYLGQD